MMALILTSGNLTMPVAHTAEIRDEDRERISGGMNGTWCMIIGMVAMTLTMAYAAGWFRVVNKHSVLVERIAMA